MPVPPPSVTVRFANALLEHARAVDAVLDGGRKHTCRGVPSCARDIMERLRARGLMLADFGTLTAHDEDET